jgi:hypothetical protein
LEKAIFLAAVAAVAGVVSTAQKADSRKMADLRFMGRTILSQCEVQIASKV